MIISAIAKTTFLENIRQPVYLVLTTLSFSLTFLSQYVTLFVLGQETLSIVETSFVTVLMAGYLIAIFSSNSLIHQEIESCTLMTVLAKPVRKEQIILGKYLGISVAIFLSCIVVSGAIVLTAWMSTQTHQDLLFNRCLLVYIITLSALTYFQLLILLALTVMFATVFPMTLTSLCATIIFFLGHLKDYALRQEGGGWLYKSIQQVYGILVPNLEFFNVGQEFYRNIAIPLPYVILNMTYTVIYTAVFLLVAMILFERRDFS